MKNILNQKDNMFKQVIKTLIQYQIQKTGYKSLFTGFEDFREEEVEILEYLSKISTEDELSNLIGQAVDKNEKLWGTAAKHYPLSVSGLFRNIEKILNLSLRKTPVSHCTIKCFTIMDDYGEYTDKYGICVDENNKLMYRSRKQYDQGTILLIGTMEKAKKIIEDLEKNIHKVGLNRRFEVVEVEI